MARFEMLELTGNRVVVTGTDLLGQTGKVVIDGTEWAGLKRHDAAHQAEAEFDAALQAWAAPMIEAQEKYEAAIAADDQDPLEYMVLHEEVVATEGRPEVRARLSKDSQILRLIEDNDFDRLYWVTESNLEILKAGASPVQPMLDEDEDEDEVLNSPFAGDSETEQPTE